MTKCVCIIVIAAGMLAGCSKPPDAPTKHKPKPQVSAAKQPKRLATPFDALVQDRDRAKGVQATVNAQAARQRKAIKAQTQ